VFDGSKAGLKHGLFHHHVRENLLSSLFWQRHSAEIELLKGEQGWWVVAEAGTAFFVLLVFGPR
jgi:hypothetical protein